MKMAFRLPQRVFGKPWRNLTKLKTLQHDIARRFSGVFGPETGKKCRREQAASVQQTGVEGLVSTLLGSQWRAFK